MKWILAAALTLTSCTSSFAQVSGAVRLDPSHLKDLQVAASDDSAFPQFASDGKSGVFMSWIETLPEKAGHRLRLSHRAEGAPWETPVTVHEGKDFWRNWADFPGVGVFPDGAVMVHWLSRSGEGTYDYGIKAAISRDAGKTWGAPFNVNTDGPKAEHGFVSFAPTKTGLGVVWLDGRETKGAHEGEHSQMPGGAMTLRFAEFLSDGTRVQEKLLDTRVCDCCQTATVSTSKGLLTAYRDRSDSEVRDISLVRPLAPIPESTREFSRDGWKVNACPVNGPSLASHGDLVAATWFTMADSKDRVRAAISKDGGDTFTAPVDIDGTFPVGRVDIALLPSGESLITWLGRGASGTAHLKAAIMSKAGTLQPAVRIAVLSIARASGFPRVEVVGREAVFAWTEVAPSSDEKSGVPPQSRIKTAVLRLN